MDYFNILNYDLMSESKKEKMTYFYQNYNHPLKKKVNSNKYQSMSHGQIAELHNNNLSVPSASANMTVN